MCTSFFNSYFFAGLFCLFYLCSFLVFPCVNICPIAILNGTDLRSAETVIRSLSGGLAVKLKFKLTLETGDMKL